MLIQNNCWEINNAIGLKGVRSFVEMASSQKDKRLIVPGDFVKLNLKRKKKDGILSAFLWVVVEDVVGGDYLGSIQSSKDMVSYLQLLNNQVRFKGEHVIHVLKKGRKLF